LTALSTGSFTSIPGITPAIITAGAGAYKEALILAFRSVFHTTLAFLLVNLLASTLFPNLDHKMTNDLAAKLHAPKIFSGKRADRSNEKN
jgi:hypothetical protein